MQAMLDANPQGKHGKHQYALEDYGLTRAGDQDYFREYCEHYDIPTKP